MSKARTKADVNHPSSFDKVMESRKELVNSILENLKKNSRLLPPNWNKDAMRPQNPVSKVYYRGGNRFRLMNAAINNGYKDPRWCTYKQAKENGWQVQKGTKGVLCEKWILYKEVEAVNNEGIVIKDDKGEPIKKFVELDRPYVNYFSLFNGENITGIPKLELPTLTYDDTIKIAEEFIQSSDCPIKEIAQEQAFYDPINDHIVLPLRNSFITNEDFLRTTLHEMAHSTGHPDRLNRPMMNMFGTPEYAREELNAEIGAIFTKFDLGIDFDEGYIEERHKQYIKSWISIFENDSNEFFRACTNADKISQHLNHNYDQFKEHQLINENISYITLNESYLVTLRSELEKNNFTPNEHLIKRINKLNDVTNHQHSLKDIYSKFHSLNSIPIAEQTLIKDISQILNLQEINRLRSASLTSIEP